VYDHEHRHLSSLPGTIDRESRRERGARTKTLEIEIEIERASKRDGESVCHGTRHLHKIENTHLHTHTHTLTHTHRNLNSLPGTDTGCAGIASWSEPMVLRSEQTCIREEYIYMCVYMRVCFHVYVCMCVVCLWGSPAGQIQGFCEVNKRV